MPETLIKGVIVESPNELKIKKDILLPIISDYEMLCKNLAGAVCTGTDLAIIAGKNKGVRYPTILGHESVGVVVAVGKRVMNFKVGDIVTSPRIIKVKNNKYYSNWGGLCEYGIATDYKKLEADGYSGNHEMYYCNQVVPDNIDISDAVMSITWSETYAYLDKINLKPNQNVLLLGSGSVALSFATMLSQRNIRVYIVGSECHKARFEHLDILEFIDYSERPAMERLKSQTMTFFDCIIDAVGDKKTVEYYLQSLKKNGKLCLYGLKDGKLYEYFKEKVSQGIHLYDENYSVKNVYGNVFKMIQEKKLCSHYWFDKMHEMTDIHNAIADLTNRKAIKILLRCSKFD